MQNTVRLLSTLALEGAVLSLAARYQAEAGAGIDADFAPTVPLLGRLRAGEAADVVILTREGLDGLRAEGTVVAESCVDLARSFVGLASRPVLIIPILRPSRRFAQRCWLRVRSPIRASALAVFSLRN